MKALPIALSFRSIPFALAVVYILLAPIGCIKYTPSAAEVAQKNSSNAASAHMLGSEEEFNAYERTLTERLQKLLHERSYLLTADETVSSYAVGAGDVLQVDVYGFGDLKADAEVSPQGTISLPLIGETDVRGRDLGSLRKHLTACYGKYIRSPKIDVSLKSYQANRVSVIGEVSRPGMYPLRRNGQLLTELLSEAGGRNQVASGRLLLLPAPRITTEPPTLQPTSYSPARPASESGTGVEIDIDELFGRIDQRPLLVPLLAGDTIVVPEAGTYEVDGEISKPGSFKLASQTSVIGAIAAAGGLTYSADVKKVEVIRDIGGGRKALAVLDLEEIGLRGGRDIRLRAGDLVRVPSEPGLFFERQIVETLNGIFSGVGVSKRVN
jgi:polysaccharide export outer membrane protein